MLWYADSHGMRMTLSRELPSTLAAHVGGAVDALLAACGHSRRDVRHWLIHPGGPRILDAVERALGLSPQDLAVSRAILREYGNMSSSTIFFLLERLIAACRPGLCVAIAFGPGLTMELALLDVNAAQGRSDSSP